MFITTPPGAPYRYGPRRPATSRRPGAVAGPAAAALRLPRAAARAPRGVAGRGHRRAAAGGGQQHRGGAGEEVQGAF